MARILIVDDSSGVRKTVREMLEVDAHEVDEASDKSVFLYKVSRAKYDVVLMDILMPEMGGPRILEQMQRIAPQLPVMIIAWSSCEEQFQTIIQNGTLGWVRKTLDLDIAVANIKNIIGLLPGGQSDQEVLGGPGC